MTTHEIRANLGDMSQAEFSEAYGIPLRTIENWDYRGRAPEWLRNVFQVIEDMHHDIISQQIEIKQLKKQLREKSL